MTTEEGWDGPDERDAAAWTSAATIADLGALGAQWLLGALRWQPCYLAGSPDPETTPLLAALVEMNERGFWTDQSQPGEVFGDSLQRAHVSGFCTEETCNRILAATLCTDLIVIASPAILERPVQIPITREVDVECTWAGAQGDPREYYEGHLPAAAIAALAAAWHVEVIDPAWGRNDLLWEVVLSGLRDMPMRRVASYVSWGEVPGVEYVD